MSRVCRTRLLTKTRLHFGKRSCSSKEWKPLFQQFREKYGDTISYLENPLNSSNIILVGTTHVSTKSADQVKDIMQAFKPSTVMVELDEERATALLGNGKIFVGSSLFGMFAGLSYTLFGFAGRKGGMEFVNAIQEAKQISAKVVYGDLQSDETSSKMSWWKYAKAVSKSSPELEEYMTKMHVKEDLMKGKETVKRFLSMFDTLNNREYAKLMNDVLKKEYPEGYEILYRKRDQHMASVLFGLTGTVVGVVGLQHMNGIEHYFQKNIEDSQKSIESAPV